MWYGPIWKAPTVIPEPRRRRSPRPQFPEDEPEGRPEFDFGSVPPTGKSDGAARKAVNAYISFLVLLFMLPFMLPFLLIVIFFIVACVLALCGEIFP